MKRIVIFTIAIIAVGSVMVTPVQAKKKQPAKSAPSGFWADSRNDMYHQSGCTTSYKPAGAQLVAGSEQQLLALGYYPDPRCLPGRIAAIRAGRIVRIDGGGLLAVVPATIAQNHPPAESPFSGGFPSLAPAGETKPAEVKPAETKPAEPKPPAKPPAKEEPKPPAATGGFPSPGGTPPTPPPVPPATQPDPAFFRASVLPVLRICSCHGQAGGNANRQFPLTGTDRDYDEAVRHIKFKDPAHSLLVQKPTGRVRHGGGQRIREGSQELKALLDWINGATAKQ